MDQQRLYGSSSGGTAAAAAAAAATTTNSNTTTTGTVSTGANNGTSGAGHQHHHQPSHSDDNLSDNESTPLTQDIYSGSQNTVQVTKGWDVFRDPPLKIDSGSMANQQCLQITVKVLKVAAYLVTFLIVLGGGVISKSTLLFMTSQLRTDRPLQYCNRDLERDKQFVVLPSITERVAWIWCLWLAFALPELGVLFRSARICFFKSWKRPPLAYFLFVCTVETMHTIGTALFVFRVLPSLDVVKGAMLTNCLSVLPAFFGMLSRSPKESKRFFKSLTDLAAIAVQISGLAVWAVVEPDSGSMATLTVTVLMISLGWWENYISNQSSLRIVRVLARIKDDLSQTRYFTYIFVSVWKIFCFFCTSLIVLWTGDEKIRMIFTIFGDAFKKHSVIVQQVIPSTGSGLITPDMDFIAINGEETTIDVSGMVPIHTVMVHIIASYLCYIFGKFACKIMIQGFSYAFPVNLTIPISVSVLITACGLRSEDPCYFSQQIPNYIFFNSPSVNFLNDFIYQEHAWIWLLWLLAQAWITIHLWTPKCERLATTEKLFVAPMYHGLFIDQSMGLNRRRDDQADVKTEDLAEIEREKADEYYETISVHTDGSIGKPSYKSSDQITRIYACTTMWHETKEEMMDFLKSILRLDEDQCARRVAQKYLRVVDPDYYEFETHIFLDDAFEVNDDPDDEGTIVNRFVKVLISTVDEAASDVHQTNIRIRPPKKYPTPYGGRLIWTLPGKTKMICHLKDKAKIRHRKRWSQVMYMYYLLGHRLMELPISVDRKDVMAENTYLLTLDGDIDFQPQAVHLLVDLMKKNRNLGAACGRIHPVGSGPLAWYQKFEYAIGHWLQKATEHMIGCVLCSPGCFSLFRGKALMDDNVLRKYTTKAEEARHYVQYDQGEDRWLCTLLLQRGYRVEYSAASDAYTHCPEGFNEFYNQRRRWVPSTMANIMDLLSDYKRTIKINDNISMPYICYQILLMGGTILGPGTIFLMLVGAFVAAFQIDNWTSFYYNIVPIMFFILVCFTCKSNVQLLIAQILSTVYALVMMAVIVGTALQLREDGYGSPSAIFLTAMSSSFLIAALLHPQEFTCIIPAIIYLLSIPSMYLLLILYSIINLNVVTWGTREIAQKKTQKQLEEEKKAEELKKRRHNSLFSFLQNEPKFSDDDDEGGIEFSLAGLFKCMFFTHKKDNPEREQLLHIAKSLEVLDDRLESIEHVLQPHKAQHKCKHERGDKKKDDKTKEIKGGANDEESTDISSSNSSANKIKRDDLYNPYWIDDADLPKSSVDYLSLHEITFWKDLIDKYLYPIDANKEEQARITKDLKDLRDRSVFAFIMINAIFVLIVFLLTLKKDSLHVNWPFGVRTNVTFDEQTQEDRIKNDLIELRNTCVFAFLMFNALFVMIVFLLQLNKDQIHVKWPFGAHTNVTYIEETAEVLIKKEYLQLEPIGLVFVFFFSLILTIQFTAMLFHRFGTLSHILAATELNFCCNNKTEELSQDALIDKHAIEIVKNLQRLQGLDDNEYENEPGGGGVGGGGGGGLGGGNGNGGFGGGGGLGGRGGGGHGGGAHGGGGHGGGLGNDEVARRRTIHNLERAAQRKRNIGTLDVAFKRRFFNMKANAINSSVETPILTRRLSMRKETMKALETRRNSVLAERQKSHMRTLGAKNEYVAGMGVNSRSGNQHRAANTQSVKDLFAYGQINRAFDSSIYDNNSMQMSQK